MKVRIVNLFQSIHVTDMDLVLMM